MGKDEILPFEIRMSDDKNPKLNYQFTVNDVTKLGIPIKVGAKAAVMHHPDGYRLEVNGEAVSVVLYIGDHYAADLVMTRDAFEAIQNGEELKAYTYQQFKEDHLQLFN